MNGEAGRCTKGAGGTRSDTGSTNLGAQYMSQMITQTEEAPPVPGNFTRHYTRQNNPNIQINCFFYIFMLSGVQVNYTNFADILRAVPMAHPCSSWNRYHRELVCFNC